MSESIPLGPLAKGVAALGIPRGLSATRPFHDSSPLS